MPNLILTRRHGESILIDDNIRITIVAHNSSGVRISIQAPKDIPVVREEILQEATGNSKQNEYGPLTVKKRVVRDD